MASCVCSCSWRAGYLGVLARHAALVTGLAQGTLTVLANDVGVAKG